jgi:hypothetical protein
MAEIDPSGWLILDTGGLLALAGGNRSALAAFDQAEQRGWAAIIPAVVLTQCVRGGPRDTPLNRVIQSRCVVLPITEALARQAGILLGPLTGPGGLPRQDQPDAVDALVVTVALQRLPASIMTTDADHIRRLLDVAPERGRVQVIAV